MNTEPKMPPIRQLRCLECDWLHEQVAELERALGVARALLIEQQANIRVAKGRGQQAISQIDAALKRAISNG